MKKTISIVLVLVLCMVAEIAKADFTQDFDNLNLPPPLKKAVVLHKGKLTSNYQYIDKYL